MINFSNALNGNVIISFRRVAPVSALTAASGLIRSGFDCAGSLPISSGLRLERIFVLIVVTRFHLFPPVQVQQWQ